MILFNSENNFLNIEPLRAKHLPMLASIKQSKRMGWMQIMLLRTWLAEAEDKLQGLVPKRQPKCIVATEKDNLIALVVIQPNNPRGTCWCVSLPEFIKEPTESSKGEVRKLLLKEAMKTENNIAKSWIVRCPSLESDQLSLLRELGFQPLKIVKNWNFINDRFLNISLSDDKNSRCWDSLNKTNAPALWKLKKRSESVLIREILDGHWTDLLYKNEPENIVLLNNDKSRRDAFLGFIQPLCSENIVSLEIIRDIAWDERLNKIIPIILNSLFKIQSEITLESSTDDDQLNKILKNYCKEDLNEFVILGKTLLKRKSTSKLASRSNSLESILEGLKPNQPPLPTPTK